MVKTGDLIAIFHSIHKVMKAEKVLKAARAEILLIPVPRQLSSDCGLAIRFAASERSKVWSVLAEKQLLPAELYRRDETDFQRVDAA